MFTGMVIYWYKLLNEAFEMERDESQLVKGSKEQGRLEIACWLTSLPGEQRGVGSFEDAEERKKKSM